MYIDDCVQGTIKIMQSDVHEPLNLGSSELVSINQLVSIVEDIAGVSLDRRYNLDAPRGVRGRNSDNTMIQDRLGWQPSISLRSGLEKTYEWVFKQVEKKKQEGS
jgi:nucleoside-diphosphate-sugar epimerase